MATAPTPGLAIHYQVAGPSAEHAAIPAAGLVPVLFIGGTGGDLRATPNVLDGPLAKARQTIAYDQRGLGLTEKPAGPYSMANYADDAAALLDHLGHPQVDVVGVSFGGMVAQHLALRHGQRIRRLVLCCSSPGGSLPSYPFHELPPDLDAVERARTLLALNDLRLDAAWQQANPERVAQMLAQVRAGAIPDHQTPEFQRGARLQLEARAGHNVQQALARITMPTLLAAGRFDGIAPAASQEALLAALPDARLQWYQGGHLFLLQDRSAWVDIIDFLDN